MSSHARLHNINVSVSIKNELPGGPFPQTQAEVARNYKRQIKSGFWQCQEFEDRFYKEIWGPNAPEPVEGNSERRERIAGAAAAVLAYSELLHIEANRKFYLFRLGPKDLALLKLIVEQVRDNPSPALSPSQTFESGQVAFKMGCGKACILLEAAARETPRGVPVTFDTVLLAMFNAVCAAAHQAGFKTIPPSSRKPVDPAWKRIEGGAYPNGDDTLRMMNERYRFVRHGRVEVLYEQKADGWTRIKPIDAQIDLLNASVVCGTKPRRMKLWNWFLKRRPLPTIGIWGQEWEGD